MQKATKHTATQCSIDTQFGTTTTGQYNTVEHTAMHYNIDTETAAEGKGAVFPQQQHTATHCNTPQHNATQLQHNHGRRIVEKL